MMSTKVAPLDCPPNNVCPFCKEDKIVLAQLIEHDVTYAVACNSPECCAIGPNRDTPNEAVASWNQSITPPRR